MINGLKDRLLNISSSAKKIILISASSVLALAIAGCSVCICAKQIVIVYGDGSEKELTTFKRYVGEVLESEKIALGTNDKLSSSVNAKLRDGMRIEIYMAYNVSVTEKGQTKHLIATRRTAGEVLLELGYNPKRTDKITPAYDEKVSEFDEITLVRIDEKTVDVVEEIGLQKVSMALRIVFVKAYVFVQAKCGRIGEINVSLCVPIRELTVNAKR